MTLHDSENSLYGGLATGGEPFVSIFEPLVGATHEAAHGFVAVIERDVGMEVLTDLFDAVVSGRKERQEVQDDLATTLLCCHTQEASALRAPFFYIHLRNVTDPDSQNRERSFSRKNKRCKTRL